MPDNVETMFSVRQIPWHQKGTVLTDHPPTSEHALLDAGLFWKAYECPLQYLDPGNNVPTSISMKAMVRDTDRALLGVVSKEYVVLQNHEAFGAFDGLVRDGRLKYKTAGSLRHGKEVWILANLGDPVDIVPGDTLVHYLLLTNSFSGQAALRVLPTSVRVVCENTKAAAIERARSIFIIPHIGDVAARVKIAVEATHESASMLRRCADKYQAMAQRPLLSSEREAYFNRCWPEPAVDEASEYHILKSRRARARMEELHEAGQGAARVRGTLWGAYNAVTELADHYLGTARTDRAMSCLFGDSARLKARAESEAMTFLGLN